MFDITILTESRYVNISPSNQYEKNILLEDDLLKTALEKLNLKVHRTNWDDAQFDWSSTKYVIFRSTWDYFDRYPEFSVWLNQVQSQTKLINPSRLIEWNIDKHYLLDIEKKGIRIPNSVFIEQGDTRSLTDLIGSVDWKEFILKPVISGAARHTYRFKPEAALEHASIFNELIQNEAMMIQEFQDNVVSEGEISYVVFGGKYSHSVLKVAKKGDFRVQDDFGGSVHLYNPSKQEIDFAENAVEACDPSPIYARVDVMRNNENELCVGELEMIEPELWFRLNNEAADNCAKAIVDSIQ